MLKPILSLWKITSVLGTLHTSYYVAKGGYSIYKKYHDTASEANSAKEIREDFIVNYKAEYGEAPPEELIAISLKVAKVRENPVKENIEDFLEKCKTKIQTCSSKVQHFADDLDEKAQEMESKLDNDDQS